MKFMSQRKRPFTRLQAEVTDSEGSRSSLVYSVLSWQSYTPEEKS